MAAAITNVGVVLACLLPLLVCVYVLWCVRRKGDSDAAVSEAAGARTRQRAADVDAVKRGGVDARGWRDCRRPLAARRSTDWSVTARQGSRCHSIAVVAWIGSSSSRGMAIVLATRNPVVLPRRSGVSYRSERRNGCCPARCPRNRHAGHGDCRNLGRLDHPLARRRSIRVVPIRTPLPGIPVHVVQPKSIGLLLTYRMGFAARVRSIPRIFAQFLDAQIN